MLYWSNWQKNKKKKKQKKLILTYFTLILFYTCEQDHKTDNTAGNCSKFANKEKSVVQFYNNNNALFSSRTSG